MSNLPALPQGIKLAELVRYVSLNTQMTKVTKLRNALNDKIKKVFEAAGVLPDGTPHLYGNIVLKFSESHKFDAVAFAKKYPFDKFPEYYTVALDTDSVPEVMKAKFQKSSVVLHAEKVVVETSIEEAA